MNSPNKKYGYNLSTTSAGKFYNLEKPQQFIGHTQVYDEKV
jgi:hypothetical protein